MTRTKKMWTNPKDVKFDLTIEEEVEGKKIRIPDFILTVSNRTTGKVMYTMTEDNIIKPSLVGIKKVSDTGRKLYGLDLLVCFDTKDKTNKNNLMSNDGEVVHLRSGYVRSILNNIIDDQEDVSDEDEEDLKNILCELKSSPRR